MWHMHQHIRSQARTNGTNMTQEELALQANAPYVGLVRNKGSDQWFIAQTFDYIFQVDAWFENQAMRCRVFKVKHGRATLVMAK